MIVQIIQLYLSNPILAEKINPENYIQHGALINHCYLGKEVDSIKRKQKPKLKNDSVGVNLVLVLEASFGDERWPVGTMSPPLFGDFNRIALMYFRMFPLNIHTTPQMPLSASYLSLHSLD